MNDLHRKYLQLMLSSDDAQAAVDASMRRFREAVEIADQAREERYAAMMSRLHPLTEDGFVVVLKGKEQTQEVLPPVHPESPSAISKWVGSLHWHPNR